MHLHCDFRLSFSFFLNLMENDIKDIFRVSYLHRFQLNDVVWDDDFW